MDDQLILKNRLKEIRAEKKLSQTDLAEMVGVSRNTISSVLSHCQIGFNTLHRFR